MRKLFLAIAIAAMSMAGAEAQVRLVIDANEVSKSAKAISEATDNLTAKLTHRWRKSHPELTKEEQDEALEGVETLVANRYMLVANAADTTMVRLTPASKPVGLIILAKDGKALAAVRVNEKGRVEYDVKDGDSDAQNAVVEQMEKGLSYTICGIGEPDLVFSSDGGDVTATDIMTGQTETYDTSALPGLACTGAPARRAAAIAGTVVGGAVAVGIIVLAAVL